MRAALVTIAWAFRWALAAETLLAVLVAIFGFGGPSLGPPWYHLILPTTQLPGMLLLSSVGLCCGYINGLVITDAIAGSYGGLTPIGMPVLFAANTLALMLLLTLGRLIWRSVRRQPGVVPPAL